MNITNTSNKELAEGICVDRSLISLLRSGKRKTPRNHDHIRHMASFFARRCQADFQFHALAEMIGKSELRPGIPTEVLVDHLYQWMSGDTPVMERVFEAIMTLPATAGNAPNTPLSPPPSTGHALDGQTHFYYGNEGKREATRQFIQIANSIEHPCNVYFCSDVHLEWLFEDYRFMNELSSELAALFQKGFTLYHIMPSLNFMNRYVESLRYWLPIYASGHAKVYYYPRLRDNLYRRSMIIIPDCCAQVTTSIGDETDLITVNSNDPELVNAYDRQFQQELAQCHPALTSHHNLSEYNVLLQELLKSDGSSIHKTFKPSPCTLPAQYLDAYISHLKDPGLRDILQMHRDATPLFEDKLKHQTFIELCPLEKPEDIRAGKVLVGSCFLKVEHHPVYTPESYAAHLEHILELMDKYETYHFIPIKPKERYDYSLFACESGLSLLLSNTQPPFMLEIRRPELSHSCYEYLMRMADLVGYTGIKRSKIRIQIKELIQELRS